MSDSAKTDFQILSLSGGGMRGLYTATVLAELEQSLADKSENPNYWIGQHFDLICGTSIGGVLALGLASGLTARELKNILDSNRKNIFPSRGHPWVKSVRQLVLGLYSAQPLLNVLQNAFENQTIGDLKTRILVPTVNYTTGSVQVFKTPHHTDFKTDWKRTIVDVALATSAAPTYFPIHQMDDRWYVDGGLAANSPALMGLHEARYFLDKSDSQIRLMLVGTMGLEKSADQSKKLKRGYWGWNKGRDLIDLTLSANEGLHNQIVRHLISDDHLLEIDDKQTPDQSKLLELDNSSDVAASTLKGRAKDRAQKIISNSTFQKFSNHQASTPTFYYGPNKNTERT
jgi:patatin-like phospholipase/acyl hydrolase